MKTLVLGYSPFDAPSTPKAPIYPFDDIFDKGVNLMHEDSTARCDAVILWGGSDIPPSFYNQPPIKWHTGPDKPTQRDLFEWEVLRDAVQRGKPIIGVCRGAQLICAFAGGKLAQHITGHSYDHNILTSTGEVFKVSSSHHQMMVPTGAKRYIEMAWTVDNLSNQYDGLTDEEIAGYKGKQRSEAEVIFFDTINAMAIQCHPEWHKQDNEFNKWLMTQIIDLQFNGVKCV